MDLTEQGWRPIETAPDNEEDIFVCWQRLNMVNVASRHHYFGWTADGTGVCKPDYWMPIPPIPRPNV